MVRSKPFTSRRSISGFTLVELMIVVAIIGILAGVALPQYKVYVVRAKLSEAIGASSIFRTAIEEYIQTQGAWPASLADAGAPEGLTLSYVQTAYALGLSSQYYVLVVIGGTGNTEVDNHAFGMLSNFDQGGGISRPLTWTCVVPTSSLNGYDPVVGKYMPSVCHNAL